MDAVPDGRMMSEQQHSLHVFRKSLPLQLRLREAIRFLQTTEGLVCLDVGADNGAMSAHLRQMGGEWHTAVSTESAAESARALVGDRVHLADGSALPFESKMFDAVVVLDGMERSAADDLFIQECHRVLKPNGRLVISVLRPKTWSLITPLRAMVGLTPERLGLSRPGYRESDLFNALKTGFDVHQMRSYMRFFVALVDVFVQALTWRLGGGTPQSKGRIRAILSVSDLFSRLADQLDMLLFFTRGHRLVAVAKRRPWRSRTAPVLTDGRSISEAVLSRPAE